MKESKLVQATHRFTYALQKLKTREIGDGLEEESHANLLLSFLLALSRCERKSEVKEFPSIPALEFLFQYHKLIFLAESGRGSALCG